MRSTCDRIKKLESRDLYDKYNLYSRNDHISLKEKKCIYCKCKFMQDKILDIVCYKVSCKNLHSYRVGIAGMIGRDAIDHTKNTNID